MTRMNTRMSHNAVRRQGGASLIIVLMILLVITVLGIGGAQLTLQAERGTRADRDLEIARQAAELALTDAEEDILTKRATYFRRDNEVGFVKDCSADAGAPGALGPKGLCAQADAGVLPVWVTAFADSTKTVSYGEMTGRKNDFFGQGIQSAEKPRYIIESTQDSDSCTADNSTDLSNSAAQFTCKILRITAMGYGPSKDTRAVMQTEFRFE